MLLVVAAALLDPQLSDPLPNMDPLKDWPNKLVVGC